MPREAATCSAFFARQRGVVAAILAGFDAAMVALLVLAPLFLAFEVAQLVLCERYLGVKQIARGADPRTLGPGERVALLWTLLLVVYAGWMLLLAAVGATRVHGLGLLLVTAIGFSLRRGAKMQWILVILTFEGAIRIGLLISLCAALWRRI